MLQTTVSNLSLFIGADQNIPLTIYQPGTLSPQNLTGWSMQFLLTAYGDAGTVYLAKNTVAGTINVTNAVLGQLTVNFANADTLGLRAGSYGWQLGRVGAGTLQPAIASGLFTLTADPNATT